MNKNTNTKNKNTKTYVTFTLVMLACMVGGFVGGMIIRFFKDGIDSIDWNVIATSFYMPSVIGFVIVSIIGFAISITLYMKAKKKYKELSNVDDEVFEVQIDKVENTLNNSMTVGTVILLLSLLMFPFIIMCKESSERAGLNLPLSGVVIDLVCFFVVLALFMTVCALVVNLEKEINPEKKGNVFDMHFGKTWLESMGESELMKTAKGAQKAYTAGIITGMILWVVCFIGILAFNTGIMPILCITIMLIVMIIVEDINTR